jgi:hypothetical protein
MGEVHHIAPLGGSADIDIAGDRLQRGVDEMVVDEVDENGAIGVVRGPR